MPHKNVIDFEDYSLVLSGGGALGIAHLGVLEELQNEPKEIVGTSMGGIIGACLAVGLSVEEVYELIEKFAKISNWIKFSFSGNSIVKSDKIEEIFDKIFENKRMKDTKIPLKVIATKLSNGDIRVFDKDDDIMIKDALLATMAIPGIFEEKEIDKEIYVDGFLCENLGINQASKEFVLAVDVLGKNSFSPLLPANKIKTKNVFEMFEKSMRILMYNQTRRDLKMSDKTIKLLDVDTKGYKTYHFHKYKEIKELGKKSYVNAFL